MNDFMKMTRTYNVYLSIALIFLSGCVEEIDFEIETFESALVIEATITNENKNQEILLSRTYQTEDDGPPPERNASVEILAGGSSYVFEELEPGRYVSTFPFSAQPSIDYILSITTSNGRTYSSTPTILSQTTQIDAVYAIRETGDQGTNGMSIYVDSFDPTGNSKYYRYSYEETYKIIAPRWVPEDLVLTDANNCIVDLRATRPQEERICYNTVSSTTINQFSTNSLTEDRVTRHLIRFIDSEDFIISWRYTILVNQYIQSREAYAYFETLNNFASEGSLFSQIQPGYFEGNVSSETNPNEIVIGFFDVSSVSSQRLYFNYEDFYPDEPLPPLEYSCEEFELFRLSLYGACGTLISGLLTDNVVFYTGSAIGPYNMVLRACGDCTALGSNVVPYFWED
ncbi:MAG: hypothetical protein ACI83B_002184 [Sediminicola sp.]|jgi:hypothetical protein